MRNAVAKVNGAIQTGGKTSLLRALQEEDGRFSDIHLENLQWYSNILAKARRDKAEAEVSHFFLLPPVKAIARDTEILPIS